MNLVTAFLAAAVVKMFESTISQATALAVFMPVVAGMGGNAGTQTLTVLVRGIALGEMDLRRGASVVGRQTLVGLMNGAVTGVLLVDGKPTEGIQITLNNSAGIDEKQPTMSQTFSGQEGKFSLSTYEQGDGVPEGEYALTFFWGQIDPRSMQFTGPDKLNDRYSDPEKSTFKVTVEKGKPVDLGRIELSTK